MLNKNIKSIKEHIASSFIPRHRLLNFATVTTTTKKNSNSFCFLSLSVSLLCGIN